MKKMCIQSKVTALWSTTDLSSDMKNKAWEFGSERAVRSARANEWAVRSGKMSEWAVPVHSAQARMSVRCGTCKQSTEYRAREQWCKWSALFYRPDSWIFRPPCIVVHSTVLYHSFFHRTAIQWQWPDTAWIPRELTCFLEIFSVLVSKHVSSTSYRRIFVSSVRS